jgi:SpoVK/Ycf46/Vps4 family AAA+-type ATPase
MTASALAGELKWPLFTIQLDGLITKYMGETAAKLRLVFDAIGKTRGVYLFDEFDAIGSRRDTDRDVGEIRRVLNSFLQFLEQDDSQSLVIAATNHPDLLDPALFRRFDDMVEYGFPDADLGVELMRARLGALNTRRVRWAAAAEAARGLSCADIARACQEVAKEVILADRQDVTTDALVRVLEERRASRR